MKWVGGAEEMNGSAGGVFVWGLKDSMSGSTLSQTGVHLSWGVVGYFVFFFQIVILCLPV